MQYTVYIKWSPRPELYDPEIRTRSREAVEGSSHGNYTVPWYCDDAVDHREAAEKRVALLADPARHDGVRVVDAADTAQVFKISSNTGKVI